MTIPLAFGPISVWLEEENQSSNKERSHRPFRTPTLQRSLPCLGYFDMVSELSKKSRGAKCECCRVCHSHDFKEEKIDIDDEAENAGNEDEDDNEEENLDEGMLRIL